MTFLCNVTIITFVMLTFKILQHLSHTFHKKKEKKLKEMIFRNTTASWELLFSPDLISVLVLSNLQPW